MPKEVNLTNNIDLIRYLKPAFDEDRMYELLADAENIHKEMCKEKGIKLNENFNLMHLESITEDTVNFEGQDFFGESLSASIPIELFKN